MASSTMPASGLTWRFAWPAPCAIWSRGKRSQDLYQSLELPLVPVLVAIERAGVRIDAAALLSQSQRIDQELASRSRQIFEIAGEEFNINSPPQLSLILFEKLSLPVLKRNVKTKTPSTAVEVLEELALAHDLPRLILEWRTLQKLKGTYIDALPRARQPGDRARAHLFQPGGRRDGAAVEQRPEPAEHPDPDRARARNQARVRRRAGLRPDLGRLLADRAAGAGPHVGRRGAHRRVRARRGHPRSHGAQGLRCRRAA